MFFGSGTQTRLMKFFWTRTRTRSGPAPGLTNFNQPGPGLTILISRFRVQKSWTRWVLVLNLYPLAQNVGSATAYSPDLKSKLIAGSVPSWVNWIRLPFTSSLTYGNHRYNKNNVKNWIKFIRNYRYIIAFHTGKYLIYKFNFKRINLLMQMNVINWRSYYLIG